MKILQKVQVVELVFMINIFMSYFLLTDQFFIFIHKQLEQIADITMKMAEIGIADSSNPHFNSIMRNHEKLLEEMKTIIEEYKQYLESKQ